ncbi:polar amino acid transport system permease protein [Variovorax sp. OK605]|jgi:octopine/nopaline transport system permease protein|uniref:ABC transporter permease n=1 Tax=unclassified Variovorax TaxID=663243 RepID=UPI0008CE87BA|nr:MULTISPECIES: ABC transporter permease subunit [unclassified Variovorax]SEK16852.1 amino acid ABC transporter membrane protein 2, PAAT family [Variovorax sp. OK202]SFE62149.1 amino acid ABC transporter membrane protein 2, PAAT family [Variovorax sp. OK212]SFQ59091.1 polar amino acid transport system permease protein [Variovorax sp. OK605]
MFDVELAAAVLPALVTAAWLTLKLTALVILLGTALALPLALCKASRSALLRATANAYVMFFRGTPSLVQIFLLYYGASQFEVVRYSVFWPVLSDPFWCVVIALGLNSASYTGKTLAAALAAVPRSMREAASVLGLGRPATFCLIELPLALRIALPAFGNEIILTCKATSLASTVTLLELTGTARLLSAETYAPYEVFMSAGIVYLALNYSLMLAMRRLETSFHRSHPTVRTTS